MRVFHFIFALTFACLLFFAFHFFQFQAKFHHRQQVDLHLEKSQYEKRREHLKAREQVLMDKNFWMQIEQIQNSNTNSNTNSITNPTPLIGWCDKSTNRFNVLVHFPDFLEQTIDYQSWPVDVEWQYLIKEETLTPSGFPKNILAAINTIPIIKESSPEIQLIWQQVMKSFWFNHQNMSPEHYLAVIDKLPAAFQKQFEIHKQLCQTLLGLAFGESSHFIIKNKGNLSIFIEKEKSAPLNNYVEKIDFSQKHSFLKEKQNQEKEFLYIGVVFSLILLILGWKLANTQFQLVSKKQRLIHTVSHEFRTPLASIIQLVEMLQNKRYKNIEKHDQYLGLIHGESMRLKHLIERVLSFAQIEKKIFTIAVSEVKLDEFWQSFNESCFLLDKNLEQNLVLRTDHKVAQGYFDKEAMVQVFSNLLENARKYGTPPYEIISTMCHNAWTVSFIDRGSGFKPGLVKNIFKPYQTQDRSNSGTGLGLSVIKEIVDAHGGTISFQQVPNQYVKFLITLPQGKVIKV